jgi:hypothetical protein
MAIQSANNYLQFSFDPYDWLNEGVDIAKKNNLQLYKLSDVTSGARVSGKNYNPRGYDASSSLSVEQQYDINSGLGSFLDQSLITDIETLYSNIVAKLDLGGDLKASRIKFTDRPLGVFSFAQASKGLIRPVEYYCEEQERIIDPNLVLKGNLPSGLEYFYFLDKEEVVLVERRQEGTTKILQSCNFLKPKLDEVSGLVLPYNDKDEIVNECNGNRLRYTSTNKKVYAYRQKKGGGIAPYVDLYIASGQNWGWQPEQMLIQAMPNILLARILEKSGVKVRIFGFYNQNINYDKYIFNSFFMIKNYGEPVDLNKIAVFLADTRFFRYYMWNAKSGWNYQMLGKSLSNSEVFGSMGSMMGMVRFNNEIMPFVRNYVDYQIKVGNFPTQVVNKKLMIFGGLDVGSNDKLMDASTQEKITNKFNSLSDYVQIQLSKTPREVMSNIIKREKEKNKSEFEIRNYLRSLITEVLTPTNEIQTTTPNDKMDKNEFRKEVQLDTRQEYDDVFEERDKLIDIVDKLIP